MSISLTPDQERFIQAKPQAGKYRSVEEVLEIALRLLDEMSTITPKGELLRNALKQSGLKRFGSR